MHNGTSADSGSNPADQDSVIRAHHEQAVAQGENRVLCRTVDGRLYSYARDEIGVLTASSHPTVRSAGGFAGMAVLFGFLAAFSLVLVNAPTGDGGDPMWGALVLTVLGLAGMAYAGRLAAVAARAKRLRRERGVPEPTSRQFD